MFYTPARNFAQKILTMLSLVQKIRALQPDIVYDLAPERTGRQGKRDQFFFQRLAVIKEYRGGGFLLKPPKNAQGVLPRIEPEWKRLLRVIGAEADANFRLRIPEGEQQRARQLFLREGMSEHARILAVGPGSKMPAKMWAQDRFLDLGQRLLAAYPDLHLLVVGGKEDANMGEVLCAAWGKRSRNLAGRLSIYGSVAALQRCLAYVGNDAGAMHLAGMVGIPCVALFSARDYPGQWEPYGTGHVILRHETECAGCMRTVCPYDNKCLSLVSVGEAERAVRSVITVH
jgi:ADP-heptose:LPS heptosyltransferase